MMQAIVNGAVYTPRQVFDPGVVILNEGIVKAVGSCEDVAIPDGAPRVDAAGLHVVPGFIDVHIHGLLGYDAMGPGLADVIRLLPRYGVTSFMATTLTLPDAEVRQAITEMAEVLDDPPPGACCAGIHVEGPHLSPAKPGMATPDWFKPLTRDEIDELQQLAHGYIRMITFAPEVGDAMTVIPHLVEHNIIPVIGHSDATFDQVTEAVRLGLAQATHTYNAMRGLHHREPGTLGAVMVYDQIAAQLIADGIHVHPAAMDILLRVKGLDRVVLISDAAPLAGLPEGEYEWEHKPVFVRDGICLLENGTIAGAHALLDTGVRNLVSQLGLPLEKALIPATSAAATSVGLDRKGRICEGCDADIVLLNGDLQPTATFVKGVLVWDGNTKSMGGAKRLDGDVYPFE
jgi:N-acetylglucosamine-6-phosphate deacetylase